MEVKAQTVADVVPAPSLLHHNDVGITYPMIYNLKMEPVRYLPLYFVVALVYGYNY